MIRSDKSLDNLEIDLLLEALVKQYGYDFRDYSRASLQRRLTNFKASINVDNFSDLIPLVLRDANQFRAMVEALSVTVTEMFRDPFVYQQIRRVLLPQLATYPRFNIWHAGCATGDEVYSLAILLHEEGLYERATI